MSNAYTTPKWLIGISRFLESNLGICAKKFLLQPWCAAQVSIVSLGK